MKSKKSVAEWLQNCLDPCVDMNLYACLPMARSRYIRSLIKRAWTKESMFKLLTGGTIFLNWSFPKHPELPMPLLKNLQCKKQTRNLQPWRDARNKQEIYSHDIAIFSRSISAWVPKGDLLVFDFIAYASAFCAQVTAFLKSYHELAVIYQR